MHLGTYDRIFICDPKDRNFILKFNSKKVSENYTLYSPNTYIYVIIHLVARYLFIHIFISTIILFYYIHNAYFINCIIFFSELVQKSQYVEY